MNRIRRTISLALVFALVGLGLTTAQAQRTYTNYRQAGELIRRVENSSANFQSSLNAALDSGRYNDTYNVGDVSGYTQNLRTAISQLRDRFDRRVAVAADVQNVLQQASLVNGFLASNRMGMRVQSDWSLLRSDLDALARAYSINWDWNQTASVFGNQGYDNQGYGYPSQVAGRAYSLTDAQLDALLRRISNESDRFRGDLGLALNRSRYDNTRAEDNINQFVSDFAAALTQLRARFDSGSTVAADAQNVLRQATYIDDFLRRHPLGYRVTNDWSALKGDLNQLASAYSVAWNWDVNALPGAAAGGNVFGSGGYNRGAYGRLTGTYRLDASLSDNANAVADRAVRSLPYSDRQRVREQIMRRLEAPDMLAIDRNGTSVTIASSRAPQTTFEATGTERREQLPNGSYSRVMAQLNGDQLIVSSTGYRETDFRVTFDPIEGGRRLRVTRQIWNDRLGQNPVTVQNVYDRTSDVADWSVYTGTSPYGQNTSNYPTSAYPANGSYIVPDGTMLGATLDTDLSTRTASTGDRFTMTVNSPDQFRGAVIEGHVANVQRSGRITGRSLMSLNFDDIRMPNGQSYQFAGFIDGVTAANGETVQVDNEGTVQDSSQTRTTEERAAIGTAVGAIIGAIAGGGKGAAIGAILGAGAGAGSVYAQGRNDLDLMRGSQVTIRASAPNR
jgi:hypothetical protein